MKKNTILIVGVLSILSHSFGQKKVFEIDKIFQDPTLKSNRTLACSNQLNDDMLILTMGNTLSQVILLDKYYSLQTKIASESLPSDFDNLIGHHIDEQGNYTIVFGLPYSKKFGTIWINPTKKYCITKKIPFTPKKQRFLSSFTYKNRLHILTIRKDASEISLYMLERENFIFKKSFSFDQAEFKSFKSNGFPRSLHDQLKDHADELLGINLMKVSTEHQNSMEIMSRPFKIYQNEDKITITLDNQISKTKVFQIDLETLSLEYRLFDTSQKFPSAKRTSSLFFQNQIFQVILHPKSMYITAFDFETQKITKNISLTSLTKNSQLVNEVEFDTGEKKITSKPLEKSDEFFKKISKKGTFPGISIYPQGDHFRLMAGSTKALRDQASSAQFTYAFVGGLVGALIYELAVSSVPTYQLSYNMDFFAYTSYNFTNALYLDTLVDADFSPISKERKLNDFDLLKEFENTLEKKKKKNKKAVNVFRHSDGVLHYNYVDKTTGKFQLFTINEAE